MGNIIASSLDSLVGYEDCDPSINESESIFDEFNFDFFIPSKNLTHGFSIFILIILTIISVILRKELGWRVAAGLPLLSWILFLTGMVLDKTADLYNKLDIFKSLKFWDKNDKNEDKPDKRWDAKWSFLGSVSPLLVFLLYSYLKYLVLRVKYKV